jgi:hypothetical protein
VAKNRIEAFSPGGLLRLCRYGVRYGIWDGPVPRSDATILFEVSDPVLDRLRVKSPVSRDQATWRLVRYEHPFPDARAATNVRIATQESSLLSGVSFDPDPRTVWYRTSDQPAAPMMPRASEARVLSWDGRTASVEHDGSCDLVINRTYYPGWFASVNDGPKLPVNRAELGIQVVHLTGSGPSRVTFGYHPENLRNATRVSLAAAGLGVALGFWGLLKTRRGT